MPHRDRSPERAERGRGIHAGWMLAAALVLFSASAAQADGRGIDLASPLPVDDSFALELGVDVTAPLTLAARMQLEMPGRVLGRFVLGGLPDAVASAYAGVGASLGVWDDGTRRAVADALGGALYLEAAIGLRPFADAGLELGVGYVLFWAQAQATIAGVAARLETGNHAVHATLGYRALIGDFVFVRIEAGWLQTVSASASLSVDQPGLLPASAETDLERELVSRGFGPTLSVSAGLRLP